MVTVRLQLLVEHFEKVDQLVITAFNGLLLCEFAPVLVDPVLEINNGLPTDVGVKALVIEDIL